MKTGRLRGAAWALALSGLWPAGAVRAQNQTAAVTAAAASTTAGAAAGVTAGAPGGEPYPPIPELHAGGKIYYDVHIRDVTAQDIIILHRGGLTSVALADLPPDLQARFGYNPTKAAVAVQQQEAEARARRAQEAGSPLGGDGSMFVADRILQSFGQPPKLFMEVNMRPRFELLGIDAKNQGERPSCAVFAVVSALEFQRAPPQGPAPRFSEEYLIWATLKTLGKVGVKLPKTNVPGFDVGFSLVEVTQALRAYGIALQEEMPYELTADNPHLYEPDPSVIDSAKLRSPAEGYWITGRDPETQIGDIVHVINQGVPVVAGVKWPDDSLIQKAVLDEQPVRDDGYHAVLIVGYRNQTNKLEDTEFLFKNSYGASWGDHGYGLMTYKYLAKNLAGAMFMDVR